MMLYQLKKLVGHSTIYGLSGILTRAIAFLLLPIYTRYLTPSDYAVAELLGITSTFVSIIVQMGMGSALFRSVLYTKRKDIRVTLSTCFYFLIVSSLAAFLLSYAFAERLSLLLFGSPDYQNLVRVSFLALFSGTLGVIPLAWLRIREKSFLYAILSVANFIVSVLLNIYFIVLLKRGVEGLVLAGAISAMLSALMLAATIAWDLRLAFSWSELRDMLEFGVPLVPMSIATSILTMADRYYLRYYSALDEVGLYSLGYKLGLIINMLLSAVQMAWPTILFSAAKMERAKEFYSRLLTYFLLVFSFVGVAISVLAKETLRLMTTEKFHGAHTIVPFVCASYILYGAYFVTAIGVNLKKETKYLPLTVGGSAVTHLTLNFLLIPKYGMMGAALSTVLSYALMAISSCAVSLKFYHIDYEYGRIIKIVMTSIFVYLLSLVFQFESVGILILAKSTLLVLYPLLLYWWRFFQPIEIQLLRELLEKSCLQVKILIEGA